jgi:uncharacterized membrane protein
MSGKRQGRGRAQTAQRNLQHAPQKSNASPPSHLSFEQIAYSGPLPPAAELRNYDDLVPVAAARMIDSMLAQSEHRRSMERDIVKANIQQSWIAMWLTFGLSLLLAVVFFVIAIAFRNPFYSLGSFGGLFTSAISGIAGIRQQQQERLAKMRILAGLENE